jgi:hypothetical protein
MKGERPSGDTFLSLQSSVGDKLEFSKTKKNKKENME